MYNIKDIVSGHFNNVVGINKSLSEERMVTCRQCPLFKLIIGGPICNSSLWINPKNNEISVEEKDEFIKGCGCVLKAKTSNKNAQCPAKKW